MSSPSVLPLTRLQVVSNKPALFSSPKILRIPPARLHSWMEYFCVFGASLHKQGDAYGVPRSKSIQTTPAHQLALAAVYYSPLQLLYWYDKPSDSQDEPELKFFDDVYTTWDDTKVLQGEVGQYISVVRRKDDEWFVGSITNNEARRLPVKLDFLPAGQKYIAEIYADGDNFVPTRTKVKVLKYRVDSEDILDFHLKASGGSAVRIVPETVKDKSVKNYRNQEL